MIIADGLTLVGSGLFVVGEFHLQTCSLFRLFDVCYRNRRWISKITRYLLPGRVVISQIVGNGILFGGVRNSAGDP